MLMKLYEVRDGNSRIGTYYAKNEKHAMQRAQDEQLQTASTFRKSQPATIFKALTAKQINRGE